jgi:two-component system cell cycle sensor histidine kinase/response regulator CckA
VNLKYQPSPVRILVVEDEILVAEDLRERLTQMGYEVCDIMDTAEDAIAAVEKLAPDLVLLDIHLRGERDGIDVANHLRKYSQTPVIFLTAHADEATLERAGITEPLGYVLKPFDGRELRAAIEMALHRHRGEQRLRKMERWLATTLQSIGDGVVAADRSGRITFMNAVAEAITGWTRQDAIGRPFDEVMIFERGDPQGRVLGLLELAASEGVIIHLGDPYTLRSREGGVVAIDQSIAPIRDDEDEITGVVCIVRDATAKRREEEAQRLLQQRMEEAQRLESLGVLAAGIAHDFNNLLTAILGNCSICQARLPEQSPEQPLLDEISQAAERAANLCNQMLAYAGKGQAALRPVHLERSVKDTVQLLQTAMHPQTELVLDLAENLPPLAADPGQLQQVITNLVLNAAEALEGQPGRLGVRTGLESLSAPDLAACRIGADLPPGDYLVLEISDTGPGMRPEILARIFDPFFTTKFQGRGLGLAAVIGIVRAHHGAVRVESTQGLGTTFRVYFSPCEADVDVVMPSLAGEEWSGEGIVLVVDDEEAMRLVAGSMLRALGFSTIYARDGHEGVEMVRARGHALRAVLMDFTMPRLNGLEALIEMRKLQPSLPVIIMSGFNREDAGKKIETFPNTSFLHKPFKMEQLQQHIRARIERAATSE